MVIFQSLNTNKIYLFSVVSIFIPSNTNKICLLH
uniref:Uncharacterized protein n=1 Tax=Arundo donax TaxID=35708 RepID=A0A0A9H9J2_ARUDO